MTTRSLFGALLLSLIGLAGCGESPDGASSSMAGSNVDGQSSCPASACALLQAAKVQSLFGPTVGAGVEGIAVTGEVSLSSCTYTAPEKPFTTVTLQVRCASDETDNVAEVRGAMTTMYGKEPADAGDAARPAFWGSKRFGNAGGTTGEYYVFGAKGVQIAVAVLTPLTDDVARAYSQELAREALEAAGQGR